MPKIINDFEFNHGGGSSFDGKTFDGQATSMNVLKRWEELSKDKKFISFFLRNKNLLKLSRKIFGEGYGSIM